MTVLTDRGATVLTGTREQWSSRTVGDPPIEHLLVLIGRSDNSIVTVHGHHHRGHRFLEAGRGWLSQALADFFHGLALG